MKYFIVRLFAFMQIALVFSCEKSEKTDKARVIFTFDDHYIDSWYAHQELFEKYEIKASFYINRPQLINAVELRKIKSILNNGHEIGCHGYNHLDAAEYTRNHSIDQYIKDEINPALSVFNRLHIPVKTFAYPFGNNTSSLDLALSQHFKGVRLATYKWEKCSLDSVDRIFINTHSGCSVNAIMIDKAMLNLEDIEKALKRVKKKQEIIIFLGHGIDSVDGLFVPAPYLENIFRLCKKYEIQSMTMEEFWNK